MSIIEELSSIPFPYYPEDKEYRSKELDQFFRYYIDYPSICLPFYGGEEPILYTKGLNHGLNYLWSHFNKAWSEVKQGASMTPMELFNDKERLLKEIEYINGREVTMGDIDELKNNPSKFRRLLKGCLDVRTISNFRPITAAAIYDSLLLFHNSVVWDPCCGFGGRLLGAYKADKVAGYIGCEPNKDTYKGLMEIKDDLKGDDGLYKIDIRNIPMEEMDLEEYSVDMVFTSPPYYDLEKYSTDETQSYIRYKSKETWIEGFLRTLCKKSMKFLEPEGLFVLNINAVSTFPDLQYAAINVAINEGFKLLGVNVLELNSRNNRGTKTEPILIFEKPKRT